MDSVNENFLSSYDIDEEPLSSPQELTGRPSILSAEKDGDLYLIKHWKDPSRYKTARLRLSGCMNFVSFTG